MVQHLIEMVEEARLDSHKAATVMVQGRTEPLQGVRTVEVLIISIMAPHTVAKETWPPKAVMVIVEAMSPLTIDEGTEAA